LESRNMQPDFGYMEDGKLGKAYDLKLMKRLGVYLKPYGPMIGLTLVLVLLMAAFDLVIPYLTKEAIDRYIVNFSREVILKGDASQEEKKLLEHYGKNLIPLQEKGRYLIPSEAMTSMDRREIVLFQKAGLLTEERYYLFIPRGKEDDALLTRYPGLFEREGPYASLRISQFGNLTREDLLVLRKRDVNGILRITLWVIVILIAHFAVNFYQVYLMELAGQRVMHDLRMRLFSHLQSLSVSFFDKNPVGRLVTRLTNDIENIHEMFTSVLVYLFKDFLLLAGIIGFLLYLNLEFALVSFSFLPLILITTLLFSHRARDAFREVRLRIAQMNAFFQENFSGIKVVQLFQREAESGRRFGKINQEHYRANMRQISIFALFVPLIEVISSGAIGLLIWYGGGKVLQETITLGALVAFISYMRMFFQPIRDLSEKYTILQSAMASLERVFLLLDRDGKVVRPASPVSQEMKGRIEFKDVSFSYDGEDKVLRDVSFSVGEGETVAIVGATGAGKTSLLHLLERFYDVEDGAIRIDGIDIRLWDISRLRAQIGLVMQDTFLFAGDIEENVRLGSAGTDRDRVRRAARTVNAEAFINRLPRGYQTQVGQGGEQLSAGEMQLLAFARALYVDPRVLVLDEATSHVDPETERLVQEGLTQLLRGRTALVIAHRLSTIHHADRIIVLHKGRVREIGNHSELMARKGYYYRLYQLQFGREIEARLEV
jgi:ATP-binding cassette subfamily B multidrug efflux pump